MTPRELQILVLLLAHDDSPEADAAWEDAELCWGVHFEAAGVIRCTRHAGHSGGHNGPNYTMDGSVLWNHNDHL